MPSRFFRYRSLEEIQQDVDRLGVPVVLEPDRREIQRALARPVQVGR